MTAYAQPTQWSDVLGAEADLRVLPETLPGSSGFASFLKLFQAINQLPVEAGGVAPDRTDFNSIFNLIGQSIFYMMNGGQWLYNSGYDYAEGRVVLFTDGKLYLCLAPNDHTDPHDPTDDTYWSRIPSLADFKEFGFTTGDFKPLTSNTIQNGWLLSNGAVISRSSNSLLTQYAYDNDLVRSSAEQAQYESDPATFAGKIYGPGDGSTTIQIPDMRGRSLMGALSAATVGRYQPEQLPNIIGKLKDLRLMYSTIVNTGALGCSTIAQGGYRGNVSIALVDGITVNASNSNSIYANSGKIHPLSLCSNYIIKL